MQNEHWKLAPPRYYNIPLLYPNRDTSSDNRYTPEAQNIIPMRSKAVCGVTSVNMCITTVLVISLSCFISNIPSQTVSSTATSLHWQMVVPPRRVGLESWTVLCSFHDWQQRASSSSAWAHCYDTHVQNSWSLLDWTRAKTVLKLAQREFVLKAADTKSCFKP